MLALETSIVTNPWVRASTEVSKQNLLCDMTMNSGAGCVSKKQVSGVITAGYKCKLLFASSSLILIATLSAPRPIRAFVLQLNFVQLAPTKSAQDQRSNKHRRGVA